MDVQADMTRPPQPAALPRSLRWRAYGVVRPLVRPIAWRLRTFFVGELLDEMAALRLEVAALRAEVQARGREQEAALEPRIAAVMEQAVLTLALDREQRRLR